MTNLVLPQNRWRKHKSKCLIVTWLPASGLLAAVFSQTKMASYTYEKSSGKVRCFTWLIGRISLVVWRTKKKRTRWRLHGVGWKCSWLVRRWGFHRWRFHSKRCSPVDCCYCLRSVRSVSGGCSPSSTSSDGSGTRSLSGVPWAPGHVRFQCGVFWSGSGCSGTPFPVPASGSECMSVAFFSARNRDLQRCNKPAIIARLYYIPHCINESIILSDVYEYLERGIALWGRRLSIHTKP